nr:hypothetical protein [Lentzea aerocolonigenes]
MGEPVHRGADVEQHGLAVLNHGSGRACDGVLVPGAFGGDFDERVIDVVAADLAADVTADVTGI